MMGGVGKWVKRKVVFKSGVLKLYRESSDPKKKDLLKESLPIGNCTVRVVEVSNRENCFQISCPSQILMLSAETKFVIIIRILTPNLLFLSFPICLFANKVTR